MDLDQEILLWHKIALELDEAEYSKHNISSQDPSDCITHGTSAGM